MNIPTKRYSVDTSHGSLVVEDSGSGQLPVLLIHGNSSCRGVFRHQLDSSLAENYRLIALDLPGHGESSDAVNPTKTYTLPGLADAVIELIERIGVAQAVVFGWSLGGHIGIEMMSRFPGLLGLMISGSPPVGPHSMAQGFHSLPQMGAAGKAELSPAEVEGFLAMIFGDSVEPFLRDAAVRTDPRFRVRLFEAARAGAGVDQRDVVENNPVPLAVVNGAEDQIVRLDYFDSVQYAHLWGGKMLSAAWTSTRSVLAGSPCLQSHSRAISSRCGYSQCPVDSLCSLSQIEKPVPAEWRSHRSRITSGAPLTSITCFRQRTCGGSP
jgi:pimeloyl-ACP methyl ester carboxylesterase